MQYTQADENPKAGLVVQGIPGHVHKVISLGQLENVLWSTMEKFTSLCLFPYIMLLLLFSHLIKIVLLFLQNRTAMKGCQ